MTYRLRTTALAAVRVGRGLQGVGVVVDEKFYFFPLNFLKLQLNLCAETSYSPETTSFSILTVLSVKVGNHLSGHIEQNTKEELSEEPGRQSLESEPSLKVGCVMQELNTQDVTKHCVVEQLPQLESLQRRGLLYLLWIL